MHQKRALVTRISFTFCSEAPDFDNSFGSLLIPCWSLWRSTRKGFICLHVCFAVLSATFPLSSFCFEASLLWLPPCASTYWFHLFCFTFSFFFDSLSMFGRNSLCLCRHHHQLYRIGFANNSHRNRARNFSCVSFIYLLYFHSFDFILSFPQLHFYSFVSLACNAFGQLISLLNSFN